MLRIRIQTKTTDTDFEQKASAEIAKQIKDLQTIQKLINTNQPIPNLDQTTIDTIQQLNFKKLSIQCFAEDTGEMFIELD